MRRTLLLTIVAVLAIAVPAGAQAISKATPNTAGTGAKLQVGIDGLASPLDGRLPTALTMQAPPGFRMDLDALARRCSEQAAKLNECPRTSRLGEGALLVEVTAPDGVRDVNIPIDVFLHSSRKILAVAFVFGWRVVPGTVDARNGIRITFDPLPKGPPFEGVSYRLKRMTFAFQARRTVRRRVNGKRRARRVDLIRTPRTCSGGSWAFTASLTYPDGSTVPMSAPTTCKR